MRYGVILALASMLSACASTKLPMRKVAAVPESQGQIGTNLVLGPSAPQSDEKVELTPSSTTAFKDYSPSRASGGEYFRIRFSDPATRKPTLLQIYEVRLSAYSKSGKGSIVVRNAVAGAGVQLPSLYDVSKVESDASAESEGGAVRLMNGETVTATFSTPVEASNLTFTFESFGDRDATVVMHLNYNGLNPYEVYAEHQLVKGPRPTSGGGGSVGGQGGGVDSPFTRGHCVGRVSAYTSGCRGRQKNICDGDCVWDASNSTEGNGPAAVEYCTSTDANNAQSCKQLDAQSLCTSHASDMSCVWISR